MKKQLTWQSLLTVEKSKTYYKNIIKFLALKKNKNKIVYPETENIFKALELTPFLSTKVVILGQDPYHGPAQAMGLCFGVNKNAALPPSLKNIYKELESDLGIKHTDGCLSHWAKQGVLLLNATLTVEANIAQSHAKIGWQTFTDTIITTLNQHPEPIIFLLWGASAQKKESLIDLNKHKIIKTSHPSPLSSYRGFLGSKPFSKTNDILIKLGRAPIKW